MNWCKETSFTKLLWGSLFNPAFCGTLLGQCFKLFYVIFCWVKINCIDDPSNSWRTYLTAHPTISAEWTIGNQPVFKTFRVVWDLQGYLIQRHRGSAVADSWFGIRKQKLSNSNTIDELFSCAFWRSKMSHDLFVDLYSALNSVHKRHKRIDCVNSFSTNRRSLQ